MQEVIVQESAQLPTSNDELLKIKDRLVKELQLNVIDLQKKLSSAIETKSDLEKTFEELKERNKEKIANLEAILNALESLSLSLKDGFTLSNDRLAELYTNFEDLEKYYLL